MKSNTVTYTYKKREDFLQNLASTCNVSRSCRLAGVDRSDMYKLRKNDPYFAEDWSTAIDMGIEALEDEMYRRAFEGVIIPSQGGTRRKYSDVLAMFLMKAQKPEKYCDRYHMKYSGIEKPIYDLDDPKIQEKLNSILKSLASKVQS